MSKTTGKDAYYFSHDCNARNDNKILALRATYGAEGYGIYWMIIEILREQPEYRYPLGKFGFRTLAMELHCDAELVENIVSDCCNEFKDENSSLLSIEDNYLYSKSLLRRMERVDKVRDARKSAASRRWGCKSNANASDEACKSNANASDEACKSNANASDEACKSNANAFDEDENGLPTLSGVPQFENDFLNSGDFSENPGTRCGSKADANALQMQCKTKKNKEKQIKSNQSKGKESKEKDAREDALDPDLSSLSDEDREAVCDLVSAAVHERPTGEQRTLLWEYLSALGPDTVMGEVDKASSLGFASWSYVLGMLSIKAANAGGEAQCQIR